MQALPTIILDRCLCQPDLVSSDHQSGQQMTKFPGHHPAGLHCLCLLVASKTGNSRRKRIANPSHTVCNVVLSVQHCKLYGSDWQIPLKAQEAINHLALGTWTTNLLQRLVWGENQQNNTLCSDSGERIDEAVVKRCNG